MQNGKFIVQLEKSESVGETLRELANFLEDRDTIDRLLEARGDFLTLRFGSENDGAFEEFPPPRWNVDSPAGRPLTLTSQHLFFQTAAGFDFPGLIEEVLQRMMDLQIMEGEMAPLGSYAFGGLLREAPSEWSALYTEYLKNLVRFDLFNDGEEVDPIAIAVQTHGWTEETLDLLAVRMFPCQGRGGGEAFQIFRDEYGLNEALEEEELEGAFDGALRREIEDLEDPGLDQLFWSCGYDPHGGAPAPGEAGTPCDELLWSLVREYLVLDDEEFDYY